MILHSEHKQYPFRSIRNLDNFSGGTQRYESKRIAFINAKHCLTLDRCKLTIPLSLENGPCPK